jgi:thiol-disulfide isomerase/thioredoxin
LIAGEIRNACVVIKAAPRRSVLVAREDSSMRAFVPWIAVLLAAMSTEGRADQKVAPEFSHSAAMQWINSAPQSMAGLRGKAVLIEFWTFDCINCRRSLPWMQAIHQRYGKDSLAVVSVHTPELAHEKDPANVREAVQRLGITYPVMLDNDFSYWTAMGNQYWPAFYLVDRDGRIVASRIGELHEGHARADDFEREIRQAIAEQ